MIFDIAAIKCNVHPIETKDYPTPAKRPYYSVLNKNKIKENFNVTIPFWKDSVKMFGKLNGPITLSNCSCYGGAGFIGSALIRHIISDTPHKVINVDKLTYASTLETLSSVSDNVRYKFEKVDICDTDALARIFKQNKPEIVMHLAAEFMSIGVSMHRGFHSN